MAGIVFERAGRYVYKAPDGNTIEYDALYFHLDVDGRRIEIVVGLTKSFTYGALRKRTVVFINGTPIVEFVATDNYNETGNLIATLKKPNSNEMYNINDELPYELLWFNIVRHRDHIDGGFDKLAILVNSSDLKEMIRYAVTRAKLKGLF